MDKLPEHIGPEIIVAYLENQISDNDLAIVQSWIEASAENSDQFEQYKAVWEETGRLIPAPVAVDIDLAWNKMSFMIDEFEEKAQTPSAKTAKIIPFRKYLLRVAAVLLPLFAIGSVYLLLFQSPKTITQSTTAQTLKDTLSDGSIISLDKNSSISYPEKFKGNTREVEMKGEGFFEIKPNKEKPFIIHAENTEIKVLGTSFNVKAIENSNEIEVTVKTGRVKFSGFGKEYADTTYIILEPNQAGIYNKLTHEIWKVDLPAKPDLQQKDNVLIFNRTNLSEAITFIQEKYHVNILLSKESMGKMRISATFKNETIDSVMEVLETTFDLRVKKQGLNYTLIKNEE